MAPILLLLSLWPRRFCFFFLLFFLSRSEWILLGFTGFFCRLSLGYTGFYGCLVDLLGFTGFSWVELGFTGFYQALLGFTGFSWVELGFMGFYQALLGFTGFY